MEFITTNIELVIIALTALLIMSLALSIYALSQFARTRRMYKNFMLGVDGKNLESGLLELVDRIGNLEEDRKAQIKVLRDIERKLSYAVQRVGMVRFNAFSDAGGELSFAIALLDSEGNGVVVSSIYGRAEARVYAKTVTRTKAAIHLSAEEEKAISQAMQEKNKI